VTRPLCRDCEHCRPDFGERGTDYTHAYCAVPDGRDHALGADTYTYCSVRRRFPGCGPDAAQFEPRQAGDARVVVMRRTIFGNLVRHRP
jgi:hypothetical protein